MKIYINRLHLPAYFIAAIMLLSACQNPNSIESKRKALSELKIELSEIRDEVENLEAEIEAMDTTTRKVKSVVVMVSEIQKKDFDHFVKVQGQIKSNSTAMVSPKSPGVLSAVYVKEGQKIGRNTLMAEMDATVVKNQLLELSLALDLAETVYEKQKALWDQKIGSEIQFLQAKNKKESLEKKIATVKSQLNLSKIYAPISGTIERSFVKVGEAVSPGRAAFQIVSTSDLKFVAEISESYIPKLRKGEAVSIYFPTLNDTIHSTINVIGESIHPVNRTIRIEATVPKSLELLKSNMIGEVSIKDESVSNEVIIPMKYIQKTELGDFVFVAEEGENGNYFAKRYLIQTGFDYHGEIYVVSGLKAGDKIITVGFQDLTEGQLLKF